MTLIALILHAFIASHAVTDSERMAAQFNSPTLALVQAPQAYAPMCLEYCTPPTLIVAAKVSK